MRPLWAAASSASRRDAVQGSKGANKGACCGASDRRSRPPLTRQCAPYGRAGYWKFVISVTILRQNSPNTTHMMGLTSFTLPVSTLRMTQVMMANMMPVAMA